MSAILGFAVRGRLLCPSTPPKGSSLAIGRWTEHRLVEFFDHALELPEAAMEVLPWSAVEDRVRLAGPCVTSGCEYWDGLCGLGQQLMCISGTRVPEIECPIRERCRWRLENGEEICGTCVKIMRGRSFDSLKTEGID